LAIFWETKSRSCKVTKTLRAGTTTVQVKHDGIRTGIKHERLYIYKCNDTHNYTSNKKEHYTCKVTKTLRAATTTLQVQHAYHGIRTGVKHERLTHWTPNCP
jgi:hypothetical protein